MEAEWFLDSEEAEEIAGRDECSCTTAAAAAADRAEDDTLYRDGCGLDKESKMEV